jgi:hypothetical protein
MATIDDCDDLDSLISFSNRVPNHPWRYFGNERSRISPTRCASFFTSAFWLLSELHPHIEFDFGCRSHK